jgi:hypothetical protein
MTGPCAPWITGLDVADCCTVECDDPSDFDSAAGLASDLLFELSGRRFAGECSTIVRPCVPTCGCPWQILSRGHIVWNPNYDDWWFGWWCDDTTCGCTPLSRVLLSGYPVQEVTEVLIDGVLVDPATYRLDNHRWLTRVRDPADLDTVLVWPGCQNLDMENTEVGTFSVEYNFGEAPPAIGQAAAAELACELFKACNGSACQLPKGVVRVARQGVTLEKTPFVSWGYVTGKRGNLQKGWSTGLALVDAFLNAYNPGGLVRQPVFWSPATKGRFAQSYG